MADDTARVVEDLAARSITGRDWSGRGGDEPVAGTGTIAGASFRIAGSEPVRSALWGLIAAVIGASRTV